MRDWRGMVVCCRSVTLLGDDVVLVEGQAVFHALLTAKSVGFDRILLR